MRWIFLSYVYKIFLHAYNSAKIIKIHQAFPELWSQMLCHLFYGSQCINKKVKSVIFHLFAQKPPPRGPICTKFCIGRRLSDVITCANFCVDRFKGFDSVRGSKFAILHWLSRSPLTQCTAVATAMPVISGVDTQGAEGKYVIFS